MSCTKTRELSLDGNLLVLTTKEGSRIIGTEKINRSSAVLYIGYEAKEVRIDGFNERHNKTHMALSADTTYVMTPDFTGLGDVTAVTLPCGTSHTPTQVMADLIMFALYAATNVADGTLEVDSDWNDNNYDMSYRIEGGLVNLSIKEMQPSESSPASLVITLPPILFPANDAVPILAWDYANDEIMRAVLDTSGRIFLSAILGPFDGDISVDLNGTYAI